MAAGNGINNLAVYFSSPDEVDLAAWMDSAWLAGKHLLCTDSHAGYRADGFLPDKRND